MLEKEIKNGDKKSNKADQINITQLVRMVHTFFMSQSCEKKTLKMGILVRYLIMII